MKLSGELGDVKFGATALKVKEWSASISRDELDVTNKGSAGWQEMQLGIRRVEGSFTADWDITGGTPPYATVEPQEDVDFTLEIGDPAATDGQSTLTFTGVVSSLEITSAVDGTVEYTGNFKNSGPVTHAVNE